MVELYCLMCQYIWHDTTSDSCPQCGGWDFMVEEVCLDWEDGHYEGDFPQGVSDNGYGD